MPSVRQITRRGTPSPNRSRMRSRSSGVAIVGRPGRRRDSEGPPLCPILGGSDHKGGGSEVRAFLVITSAPYLFVATEAPDLCLKLGVAHPAQHRSRPPRSFPILVTFVPGIASARGRARSGRKIRARKPPTTAPLVAYVALVAIVDTSTRIGSAQPEIGRRLWRRPIFLAGDRGQRVQQVAGRPGTRRSIRVTVTTESEREGIFRSSHPMLRERGLNGCRWSVGPERYRHLESCPSEI